MSGAAYRDRGFSGTAEMDRKRIKEALEKHSEKPSPSTSRGVSREKELLAAGKITTTIGKVPKVSEGGEDLAVRPALLLVFSTALPTLARRPGLCYFSGKNHMLRCHCIFLGCNVSPFAVRCRILESLHYLELKNVSLVTFSLTSALHVPIMLC